MLNRVTVMGRLTRDPELRRTQSGTSVTSFSVAVERNYKGENGEKTTDFFDVVAWRTTAEFVCKYFGKGRMIVVDGQLQSRKWTDKNGNNRTSVEILADNCYFGDSKSDGSQQSSYGAPQQSGYGGYPSQGYSQQAPAQQPAYGQGYAPQQGYGTPAPGGFEEIEDDGELPF